MENRPNPAAPWAIPQPLGAGKSNIPEMLDPANRILGVEQAKLIVVNREHSVKYGLWMPQDETGRNIFDRICDEIEACQVHIMGRTREDAKAMAQSEAGTQPQPMSANMFTGEQNRK